MDFDWTPEQTALRDQARTVAAEAVARYGRHNDSWINGFSKGFAREMAEHGWIGMTWPVEFGGGGQPAINRLIVGEELIAAGAPIAAMWFADRQMGPTLLQFGTQAQQRQHLPAILDGTSAWSIGMSEPDAGSDVASIRTRAVLDGDTFVINGQKIWNSGAAQADWIYLIARTDPDAKPHAGLSELIVDMRSPGITIVPIKDMTGSDHFCEVFFEDVRVPAENLVGQLNGSFQQVMRQMEHERGGIDRLLSNRKLYVDVLAVADTTDPRLRQEIAAIETGYRIGRLMVLREVLGQAPQQFSAATKTFCTELEQRIATFGSRALGSQGMLAEPGLPGRVSRGAAYAPAYTIMGGTSEILRNILGERVLGLPR